jgi:UDP-N-acetylmuramate dehydrogenase
MQIQENVALAPLTTLQVGGPARYFAEITTPDEAREALQFARTRSLPLFILGGGSNLLVSDQGFPGLVLHVGLLGINHRHGRSAIAYFDVGAGEDWDGLVAAAVTHRCSGIECLSGIPGSVGGTPVQNVGAYGQEVAETIDSVVAMDVNTGEEQEFEKQDCRFGYRTSIFNTAERGRWLILRVSYALKHDGEPKIAYADLQKYFADLGGRPTLAETREAVRKIRATKSMLITPGDEDSRSAGSFFKNPVLGAEQFAELARRAEAKGLEVPNYPALEAQRKVPAAWLVEHSGFEKGYTLGHAGISRRHALALVNRGGATAQEILALKDRIQQSVQQAWGILLEPEPIFVGF